jgi:hypothetical protein
MTADLAVIDRGAGTSIAVMQERGALIRQVMSNVLEEGKDYGRIPGTDKPTLFKPGAEKLCLTFALGAVQPNVEDLSTPDAVRYRVSVPIEAADGRILAVGIGEASTDEEKYRWKKPVCDEEFQATPEHCRRVKWTRGGSSGAYQVKQIRTSPADLANTVLKMAHKRAFVAGTLLATGASSVFNQDLEDFSKELQDNLLDDEATVRPTVKRTSEKKPAAPPKADVSVLVTKALPLKDVRVFGKDKNNYAITLVGDPFDYTTKDAGMALELETFKGTDHVVQITYEDHLWQGKTYHNLTAFVVIDAPTLTAGDIPF